MRLHAVLAISTRDKVRGMSSILDLLHQSLLLCGMRASGETVDADLAQDALTILHQLIESWTLESLLVYQIQRQVFPLTTAQTYTVGPGGDFSMPRPVTIHAANWRDEAMTPALELPLHAMQDQEYQNLAVRELAATMPVKFYYDQAWPLGVLFLWPKPLLTKQIVLFLWHPWDTSMVLADTVAFPPGYERMVVYNLAVELSAQPGARVSERTANIAAHSKAMIEQFNARVPILSVPAGLMGRYAAYNPLTDNT
jgi:hypothetical protein